MTDIDKQDKQVMEKLWSLRDRLPPNLDPEIYLLIGMATGTISRLRDEKAKLAAEILTLQLALDGGYS